MSMREMRRGRRLHHSRFLQPRLTAFCYFKEFFGVRVLRKFGFLAFFQAFFFSVITTFVVLFATDSVGLTTSDFGKSWSVLPLLSLFLALPMGLAVEKYLLVKQGVFRNTIVRGPVGFVLDDETRREVDRLFDLVKGAVTG